MTQFYKRLLAFFTLSLLVLCATHAQKSLRLEPIPYGDMNKWQVRIIEESFVIGGKTKTLYEVADPDTIRGFIPYKNSKSPWENSNVLAKVSGVVKTSITVFPEYTAQDTCARLETRIEKVKVLGLINIEVLAAGTLFLGQMHEPISDTKNPQGKLVTGIPFNKRPQALVYDYKVKAGGKRIKVSGFSRPENLPGINCAEVCILLQKRWEDKKGNVYAKRVATGWERFNNVQLSWQRKHMLPLAYGNISHTPEFKPYMALNSGDDAYYTVNSKGKSVPIREIEWADANDTPTHLILRISSSHGGAYMGTPGSTIWIDNVNLGY